MEAVDEEVAAPPSGQITKDPSPIAKGKRTKRYRTHSPIPFTTRPPSIANQRPAASSSSSSADDSTTTEEEDTARCLILLAQGHFPPNNRSTLDHRHRQVSEPKMYFQNNATTSRAACMYTCKTCNRAFSSFQALGGHRASHKKPKNENKSTMFSDEEDFPHPSSISSFRNRMPSNTLSLQLSNISNTNGIPKPFAPSPRIHECSYCGAEFNSGQALGGHMRRHRAGPISPRVNLPPSAASPSPRNVLSLDLNLPAPEDENQRFGLAGPRQQKSPEEKNEVGEHIVLSTTTTAPALVDCHY